MKIIFVFLLLAKLDFSIYGQSETGAIQYFLEPTLELSYRKTIYSLIPSLDRTKKADTIFHLLTDKNVPVAYYMKIKRPVCFDGKCRLLNVNLYWNVTGRYLGLALPKNEFLSRANHEPFAITDYHQMNEFLADSLSPLSNFDYSEIIPRKDIKEGIDAVTSPTSKAVSDYVVKGAGYTTYVLWHIVYSEAQTKIKSLTESNLSVELFSKILASPNGYDKNWAISRLRTFSTFVTPILFNSLISLINDDDYVLAITCLDSIPKKTINDPIFQEKLVVKFDKVSYSLKSVIVNKLIEADNLSQIVKSKLVGQINNLSGSLFINVLNLFEKQGVNDSLSLLTISTLLESNNSFIAKNAHRYLLKYRINSEIVKKRMQRYAELK